MEQKSGDDNQIKQDAATNFVLIIVAVLGFIVMFLILRDGLIFLAKADHTRIVIKVITEHLTFMLN
jgi:hypothetical protein